MAQIFKADYDAVIVGSGPNGLAAAIAIRQQGLSVLVIEGKDKIGGGLRTEELTLPGFKHDVCSAIHPLAVGSPFFQTLPLVDFGLEFLYPAIPAAHPLDGGSASLLLPSVEATAKGLGADEHFYRKLMSPIVKAWPGMAADVLGPLRIPKHPIDMARFGLRALTSAQWLARRFKTEEAKALLGGMASHSIQPLSNLATSAIALVLMANGHLKGWPAPKGGSVSIANALVAYYKSIGGEVATGTYITNFNQLPSARAVLFDVTPAQLLQIAGHRFSSTYQWQLKRYRYGMGVFKIDWAIEGEIPFTHADVRAAGTVHVGGTFNEIAYSESQAWRLKPAEKPYVLLAQQGIVDSTRAPQGKQAIWGYCHVPRGSVQDMTNAIEQQVERFAPGFRDRILARHTFNTQQLEEYNPNYIGGDINGGVIDIGQLFTRPVLRSSPYRTSAKGLYICSSSTPPGGGVHGMCGYHAARRALKDIFGIKIDL